MAARCGAQLAAAVAGLLSPAAARGAYVELLDGSRMRGKVIALYCTGLLSDTRKRNAETMALEIGLGRVRALQRLLLSAKWDEDADFHSPEAVVEGPPSWKGAVTAKGAKRASTEA